MMAYDFEKRTVTDVMRIVSRIKGIRFSPGEIEYVSAKVDEFIAQKKFSVRVDDLQERMADLIDDAAARAA